MTWREYHEATKHHVGSLRGQILDWANMPDPFRHYEGVPILDLPADPPATPDRIPLPDTRTNRMARRAISLPTVCAYGRAACCGLSHNDVVRQLCANNACVRIWPATH